MVIFLYEIRRLLETSEIAEKLKYNQFLGYNNKLDNFLKNPAIN